MITHWGGDAVSLSRPDSIRLLGSEPFDLLVIGGGITGAGIAQDAAHRGLRVALVEKGDFASGTTHASTKLLHGGLRYLEQFQFRLMYEALHERNRLARLAPALAEWLPFLIPIYSRGWSAWRIRIGLWLYDLLAGFPAGHLHRRISRAEALALAPFLDPAGLRGAFLYYDCRTYDTRLALAVLRSAREGGAVAANYCEVEEFLKEGGRIVGARVRDLPSGASFDLRASCTINATGVWADRVAALDDSGARPRLRPSKGVHIVVAGERMRGVMPATAMGAGAEGAAERSAGLGAAGAARAAGSAGNGAPGIRGRGVASAGAPGAAVLAPSPHGDGRYLFVVPWEGVVLLGPTDTPYGGDPDAVGVGEDDVAYILASANQLFPGLRLTEADILGTFGGLRPLIEGAAKTTSQLSREHQIWESADGLISIAGGKLTTYRTMAAEATDLALVRLGREPVPCRTGELPLSDDYASERERLVREYPDLREPLGGDSDYARVDVALAARESMAVFPEDFLYRRTPLALTRPDRGAGLCAEVEGVLERFGG
jgi:glycerol-3-phosphate dehydrogenase